MKKKVADSDLKKVNSAINEIGNFIKNELKNAIKDTSDKNKKNPNWRHYTKI